VENKKPKNIDVAIFVTLGDILMITPIISLIKKTYPDSTIRVHTNTAYVPLLENNPDISTIIESASYADVYRYQYHHEGGTIVPLGMANRYDTLWHHTPETRNRSMIDWYYSRTKLTLPPLTDRKVRLYLTDSDRAKAQQIMADNQLEPDKFVVIHTTSRVPSKDWPIEKFAQLDTWFSNNKIARTVQVGMKEDSTFEADVDLLGQLSIKEVVALAENAALFIGCDSGPTWAVSSIDIPMIVIMGATTNTPMESNQKGPFVGPVGNNITYIEPLRIKCATCNPIPCYNHCQIKNPCINSIDVEQVIKTIMEKTKLGK
jgi:ADP-heptose:LPS heptosyltransferase